MYLIFIKCIVRNYTVNFCQVDKLITVVSGKITGFGVQFSVKFSLLLKVIINDYFTCFLRRNKSQGDRISPLFILGVCHRSCYSFLGFFEEGGWG